MHLGGIPARSAQAPATFSMCLNLSLRMGQRLSERMVSCPACPPLADADICRPLSKRCPRSQPTVPYAKRTLVLGCWQIRMEGGGSPLPGRP